MENKSRLKIYPKGNFASIPNELIYDEELSTYAKFIYIYLKSKPEVWEFYNFDLWRGVGLKEDAFRKHRNFLIEKKWIYVEKQKSIKGQFKPRTYHLFVHPNQFEETVPDIIGNGKKPYQKKAVTTNNRDRQNPALSNKDYTVIKKKKKKVNNIKSDFKNFNPNPRIN